MKIQPIRIYILEYKLCTIKVSPIIISSYCEKLYKIFRIKRAKKFFINTTCIANRLISIVTLAIASE